MQKKINVLCAARDRSAFDRLRLQIDDEESLSLNIVSSGDAAYADVCRLEPDILITDAVLPGMDGLGLIDRLRKKLGDRMPCVIGGAEMPFAREGFEKRGACAVVSVPWRTDELKMAVLDQVEALDTRVDWEAAEGAYGRAAQLLRELGMKETLKGFSYLAWAAALAHCSEGRLFGVAQRLYKPIAERMQTTPQSVERLIRHAVESTMDRVGAPAMYSFFGNTIDPTRGKPTNAHILYALVQRMRII